MAAGLEKARASGPRSAKQDEEDEKPNLDDVASDELARRLHSEMNASPRLSRGGERAGASSETVDVAPPAGRFIKQSHPIRATRAKPRACISTTTTANACFFLPQL